MRAALDLMQMGQVRAAQARAASGGSFGEVSVLRAGDAYQRVIDWHVAKPTFA